MKNSIFPGFAHLLNASDIPVRAVMTYYVASSEYN